MVRKKAGKRSRDKPTKSTPDSAAAARAATQAKVKAKAARVKTSGLTSRVRGHVSARTRRDQAKRDAKG